MQLEYSSMSFHVLHSHPEKHFDCTPTTIRINAAASVTSSFPMVPLRTVASAESVYVKGVHLAQTESKVYDCALRAEYEQGFIMTTPITQEQNAGMGLAVVRLTVGAMFVWVFFENLGKGLYTAAGYANLIHYYLKASHAPSAWKAVMTSAANHAALAGPMQATAEISLGILLVLGLLTRPAAFVAFLFLGSLWISEWGTSWIWELLVPVLASLGLALGRAGRTWGVDAWLSQRWPGSPWW